MSVTTNKLPVHQALSESSNNSPSNYLSDITSITSPTTVSPPNPHVGRSWVWLHFEVDDANPNRVRCIAPKLNADGSKGTIETCGLYLTRDKTGSTGGMNRHLRTMHHLTPPKSTPSQSPRVDKYTSKFQIEKISLAKKDDNVYSTKNHSEDHYHQTKDNKAKSLNYGSLFSNALPVKKLPTSDHNFHHLESEEFKLKLAKFLLENSLASKALNTVTLRSLVSFLNPEYTKYLSAYKDTITDLYEDLYFSMKQDLKDKLANSGGKISLNCGVWYGYGRGRGNRGLFIVVAHWIDKNWLNHSSLLSVSFTNRSSSSRELTDILLRVIEDYSIEAKIFCILTDNSLSFMSMGIELMEKLSNSGFNFEEHLLSCLVCAMREPPTIALMEFGVSDDLISANKPFIRRPPETVLDASNVFDLIFDIAESISSSRSNSQLFRGICQATVQGITDYDILKQDMKPKNWVENVDMLKRAKTLKLAINKYVAKIGASYRLTEKDWGLVDQLIDILEPVCEAFTILLKFSSETGGLAVSVYDHLVGELSKRLAAYTQEELDPRLAKFAGKMMSFYYENLSDSELSSCFQMLDPNIRSYLKTKDIHFQNSITNKFLAKLKDFYRALSRGEGVISGHANTAYDSFIDHYSEESFHAEVERYLGHVGSGRVNPFEWWKDNSSNFPVISKMAIRYLSVPGAGMACMVSMISGRQLDQEYWDGSEDNLRMKLCLQNWTQCGY